MADASPQHAAATEPRNAQQAVAPSGSGAAAASQQQGGAPVYGTGVIIPVRHALLLGAVG